MMHRKNSHWTKLAVLLLFGGAVFLMLLMMGNTGTVIRGVTIGNLSTEKLTYEELAETLQKEAGEFVRSSVVLVLPDGTEKSVLFGQLGVTLDSESTLLKTYDIGRNSSLLGNASSQIRSFIIGTHVAFESDVQKKQLEKFVTEQLSDYHRPAREIMPVYNVRKGTFALGDREEGIVIDLEQFANDINQRASLLENSPITLIQLEDIPTVTVNGAENSLEKVRRILSADPFTISYGETSFDIEKADWISWLEFLPNKEKAEILDTNFSEEKINEYLVRFAPGINEAPINAEFTIGEGRVTEFNLSRPGRELNITESVSSITDSLLAASLAPIGLSFRVKEPGLSSADINDLGIISLLSSGESDFAGSPTSRIHNIRVGSNKFQGTIIAPGEEFSFNTLLGDVTAKEGYLPELVIKRGETIPEYGGGLCQVSTTLFRAAVYAGLEITNRYNHSYAVSYYGEPGFDATIYPPNPDMRFLNNTKNHILIQYKIVGTKLLWEIYGTDDGRTVELDGPHVYDKKPDGSMKAWLTQKVFNEEGEITYEKTFYSNYKSPDLYPVNRNPLE